MLRGVSYATCSPQLHLWHKAANTVIVNTAPVDLTADHTPSKPHSNFHHEKKPANL